MGKGVLHPLSGGIRNSRAGLIVVTGDVTDRGTVAELKAAVKELTGIGVPFRLLPGNHDHYGHQGDPQPTDVPVHDRELGTGTFSRWEEIVGPRWWSMHFGGMHLVALDWFSARTGLDHAAQLRWLAADLALLPPGYPVVLLSHEQPNGTFLQSLKRQIPSMRLAAVLSGHRHASRGIRASGTLHLSTGPAIVDGRDWSPPQMRVVEWDTDELVNHTILSAGTAPPRFRASPPKWSFQTRVASAASSLQLATHPDGIIATTADHDQAGGTLALLDDQTGKLRWSWDSPQPVAAAAAVHPEGSVFLQTVGGLVVRVDDGRLTWMIEAADPACTWVTSTPVLTADGGLITEGPGLVRCLKCTDGRVRWTQHVDNADIHHLHPSGRMCGGFAVLPLAGQYQGLTVLNPLDGAIQGSDGAGMATPRSSPAPLDDGTALIVRDGAVVERFEVTTGRVAWSTTLDGPASGATPVIIDELALVVTGDAVIHILDSRTGWLLRDHRLPRTTEPFTNRAGTPSFASAALAVGGFLHLITVTGEWWRLDPFHWEPVLVASLPVAVTGQPVEAGLNLLVPGREGIVLAASLQTEATHTNSLQKGPEATGGRRAGPKTKSDRWLKSLKLLRA